MRELTKNCGTGTPLDVHTGRDRTQRRIVVARDTELEIRLGRGKIAVGEKVIQPAELLAGVDRGR